MRHLKSILIALLATVVLIGIIGFFLNKEYKVKRDIVIQSSSDSIFYYVKNLETWPKWTVWNKQNDPDLEMEFQKDKDEVKGMSWLSKEGEKGSLSITGIENSKQLSFTLQLEESFETQGQIKLNAKDSLKTEVTWTMEGNVGNNLPQRFFILFADRFLGPDLEESLKGLKRISEKQ